MLIKGNKYFSVITGYVRNTDANWIEIKTGNQKKNDKNQNSGKIYKFRKDMYKLECKNEIM